MKERKSKKFEVCNIWRSIDTQFECFKLITQHHSKDFNGNSL